MEVVTVSADVLDNLFKILLAFVLWTGFSSWIIGTDTKFGRIIWFIGTAFIMFAGVLTLLIWAEGQGLSILQ